MEDAEIAAVFGRRLRYERARHGLTLSDLARQAGFSQGRGRKSRREVICRYERGETIPLLSTAKRLADALGIGLDTLITEPPTTVPVEDDGEEERRPGLSWTDPWADFEQR